MRFLAFLFFLAGLCACSVPSADEAGPPPADYKAVIKQEIRGNVPGALLLHNVEITEPQPGRAQFVPGWRVCVRARFMAQNRSYFFADGQLQKIDVNDPLCAGYTYAAWPEMDAPAPKPAAGPVWTYRTASDDLRQRHRPVAELVSRNSFDLKFPYEGGTHGMIRVTRIETGLSVGLLLDRGQIECGKTGCRLSLRFDDDPVETVDFIRDIPTDRSIVDALNGDRFYNRLKSSNSLIFELDIPGNGRRQVEFDTGGLDLSKLD